MGRAKEWMLQQEGDQRWALSVLAKAGVLAHCPYHGEYFCDGGEEVQEAYKLANTMISRGEAPFDASERTRATDAIKSAYESHNFVDSCRSCDKIEAE